jgi:hypothetical protein
VQSVSPPSNNRNGIHRGTRCTLQEISDFVGFLTLNLHNIRPSIWKNVKFTYMSTQYKCNLHCTMFANLSHALNKGLPRQINS